VEKMKDNFKKHLEFNEAVEELDSLIESGFFGEDARKLVEDRGNYDNVDYFIRVLTEWHEDKNQVNKHKSYEYISIIFNLYTQAVKENPEESVKLISNFKLGPEDNTAMEFATAYTEYARVFNDTKLLAKEVNTDPQNLAKRLRYTKSISVAYMNGIEYISKTLNLLICLEKIVKKEQYDFYSINKMTLHNKILLFNSENKYDILLEMIDRELRNAEAHATINYVDKTKSYKIKYREGGEIKEKNIPFTVLFEKLILVGNYVQSIEYAGQLLYIGLIDRDKFVQMYMELFTNQ